MQVLYQDLIFEFTFTVQNTNVFFLNKSLYNITLLDNISYW